MFTAPDGSLIDLRSYIVHSEQIRTEFHGSPTLVITDEEALDVMSMLQATPPAVIHNLDSLTLKYAYSQAPYEVNLIHDSCGCHPNHFDQMTADFRRGFYQSTAPGYLERIAKEWGQELTIAVGSDTSWRQDYDSWINMFN
jgi:DNA-directed RNA polymerase